MRNRDAFRGCLVGCAAGDALGYEVEFMQERDIFDRFGPGGITAYVLRCGVAQFSDDTQMTLFTAEGLIRAGGRDYAAAINQSYLDWLRTQDLQEPPAGVAGGLAAVPGLYRWRAPGNSCLTALRAGGGGTLQEPINRSKGCGGVMRVAPIGLFFNDRGVSASDIARLGAEAAALTHGHPLGWMPAAALTVIIHEIAQNGADVPTAARRSLDVLAALWPDTDALRCVTQLVRQALSLAVSGGADIDCIHELGEGWVGEEALAIALFCAARYEDDFGQAIEVAVNHRGDSDSTGAVAGQIVGIPVRYTQHLELLDVITAMADDLFDKG